MKLLEVASVGERAVEAAKYLEYVDVWLPDKIKVPMEKAIANLVKQGMSVSGSNHRWSSSSQHFYIILPDANMKAASQREMVLVVRSDSSTWRLTLAKAAKLNAAAVNETIEKIHEAERIAQRAKVELAAVLK